MTPEELRQRQAPIKARYRAEPAAARQTFRAEALLHPEKHPFQGARQGASKLGE